MHVLVKAGIAVLGIVVVSFIGLVAATAINGSTPDPSDADPIVLTPATPSADESHHDGRRPANDDQRTREGVGGSAKAPATGDDDDDDHDDDDDRFEHTNPEPRDIDDGDDGHDDGHDDGDDD